ncbi:hypothetical protein CHS0354_012039 [Potamilus streckersoni]|uniref:G-protein coupled receptors family 1 profile domain-containing protein n=1 Tax=Potamilus streckersoni TaxID=2493646 RepID=A0AAE0TJW4_9BIVA|nr:hypothetical protein CHS0354_012039 [Potamilus streckersoni]
MDAEQNIQHNGQLIDMNVLSENIRSALEPVTILVFVETSVGIVSNIFILLVYWLKYPKCGFRVFVILLATYDLISCFTTLPLEAVSQLHWYSLWNQWECKLKCFFNVFTTLGSGQTLFLIALDRYRKICGSFNQQVRTSCTIKQSLCTVIISFISSFPILFIWEQKLKLITYKGHAVEVLVCDEMSSETWLPFLYLLCTFLIPIGILMLTSMLMNISVLRKIFCNLDGRITASKSFTLKRQRVNVKTCNKSQSNQNSRCLDEARIPENCSGVSRCIGPNQLYTCLKERHLLKKDCATKCRQCSVIDDDFEYSLGNIKLGRKINSELMTKSCILNPLIAEFEICSESSSNNSTDRKGKDPGQTAVGELIEMHGKLEELGTGGVSHKFSIDQEAEIVTDIALDVTTSWSSQDSSVVENATFARARRKTLIMFILTSLFVFTLITYVVLLSTIAKTDGFLLDLDSTETLLALLFEQHCEHCSIRIL